MAYAVIGNYHQAIADATKAIKIDPNNTESYVLRGICLEKLGATEEAISDYLKAKELGYTG